MVFKTCAVERSEINKIRNKIQGKFVPETTKFVLLPSSFVQIQTFLLKFYLMGITHGQQVHCGHFNRCSWLAISYILGSLSKAACYFFFWDILNHLIFTLCHLGTKLKDL